MKALILSLIFNFFIVCGVISQYDTAFNEQFTSNTRLWSEEVNTNYETDIRNGVYYVSHKNAEGGWNFWKSVFMEPDKDFVIESKITQVSGIINNGYGIIWGAQNVNNCYKFVLASNGYYSIFKYEDGNYSDIIEWTSTTLVNPMGTPNVLKIEKRGNRMYFFINDSQVEVMSAMPTFGMNLGFSLSQEMAVEADYLLVLQEDFPVLNLVANPINNFTKINLGPQVNSEYSETMPIIAPDGRTLFFCKKDHPGNVNFSVKPNDDVWVTYQLDDGKWSEAQNMGWPINNDGNNTVISVSPDGNTLLLMNHYSSDGNKVTGAGISISNRTQNGWEIPKNIEITDFYNDHPKNYSEYCLSADKQILMMTVQRKDSYGGKDVYVSFKEGDAYSKPVNLGEVVNTFADEISPFLASDNQTLYFATAGKRGYGDADVFVSRRLDDTWLNWSEPENLGPEINTTGWDAYYTVQASGTYTFLISTQNSLGQGDVFKIQLPIAARPKPVVLIYGKVLNFKTNEPIAAGITYQDLTSNKIAGNALSSPVDGTYKIVLPNGKNYSFLAERDNFYAISDNIDLSDLTEYKEIERNLYLNPIEKGEVIRLNNLFFDHNKATLKAESYQELDRLIDLLNQYQSMIIEISGHTDSDGSTEYNYTLLQERAKSVLTYLIAKGIQSQRIVSKGYGETKPIADNSSEAGKAKNRRVEFIILEK